MQTDKTFDNRINQKCDHKENLTMNTKPHHWQKLLYLISAFCITHISTAQTSDPTVIASASGEGRAGNVSISWTLGETAIRTGHSINRIITEGFHQPGMILSPRMVRQGSININIAPNPTYSAIQVNVQTDVEEDMLIYLNDIKGTQMLYQRLPAKINQTTLNVQGLATGIYFLQIRNTSGSLFKSFKVIKL